MSGVWVRGAERILDPGSGVDVAGDLWVEDGRIAGLGAPPRGRRGGLDVVEASGCLVTPMFVDLHVHLREPGGEESETIATGTAAALAGGFATVFAMPNTSPPCDTPEAVRRVLERAARAGPCEVVPVSALSKGLEGRELVDLDAQAAAGAGAFSDDGAWLADERLASEAFAWAARNDRLVMQHCEDASVSGGGVVHDSPATRRTTWPRIPREAEDRAVERDIALAARHGTRLHVCHVSTAGAVEALRRARASGLRVSGEAAPHHLVLRDEDAVSGGPDFKMKPPLREREDVEALLDALADGTIEAVATDHAPHPDAAKARGIEGAPFGAIGTETAFPVLYTRAVLAGRLGLDALVAALTSGPARVAGRIPGRLVTGAPAAVNVIDVRRPRRVDREALRSRSHNCPFDGMDLRGWPLLSLLGGRTIRHLPA